jgi:zinc protease
VTRAVPRAATRAAMTALLAVLAAAMTPTPVAASRAPGSGPAPEGQKKPGEEGGGVRSKHAVDPSATKGDATMTLLPAGRSPLVTFRIQFATGAIDDPEGKEGLAALTALTIGAGGTKELSYREVVDRLYPMAGVIHAQPDREATTFVGEVHRDHAGDLYQILSGLLLTPRFDEADYRRNRDLLVASIETGLRGNDEEELGKEALNASIYFGHPYGRPVAGLVTGLKLITLDEVKEFYAQHYTRAGLVIGLAGGYPVEMPQRMREDFRALRAAPAKARPALPAPPAIEGIELTMVEKPTPTAAISIGAPIDVTRSDRDFYALLLANSYLGEHRTFNGRLMNIMRAARGLNYGDYSYIESFIQEGGSTFPLTNIPRRQQTFSIWIRPVARNNAAFALREAVRELQRLVDQGMTRAELDQTRAFLLNYSRLWAQSQSRRLGYLMDSASYGIPSYIDRVQEVLPKLTLEEVNAAIRKHLHPANLKVAIVAVGARGLLQQLTSGEPTPITYQTPTTDPALLAEDKEIAAYPLKVNAARVRILQAATLFEE